MGTPVSRGIAAQLTVTASVSSSSSSSSSSENIRMTIGASQQDAPITIRTDNAWTRDNTSRTWPTTPDQQLLHLKRVSSLHPAQLDDIEVWPEIANDCRKMMDANMQRNLLVGTAVRLCSFVSLGYGIFAGLNLNNVAGADYQGHIDQNNGTVTAVEINAVDPSQNIANIAKLAAGLAGAWGLNILGDSLRDRFAKAKAGIEFTRTEVMCPRIQRAYEQCTIELIHQYAIASFQANRPFDANQLARESLPSNVIVTFAARPDSNMILPVSAIIQKCRDILGRDEIPMRNIYKCLERVKVYNPELDALTEANQPTRLTNESIRKAQLATIEALQVEKRQQIESCYLPLLNAIQGILAHDQAIREAAKVAKTPSLQPVISPSHLSPSPMMRPLVLAGLDPRRPSLNQGSSLDRVASFTPLKSEPSITVEEVRDSERGEPESSRQGQVRVHAEVRSSISVHQPIRPRQLPPLTTVSQQPSGRVKHRRLGSLVREDQQQTQRRNHRPNQPSSFELVLPGDALPGSV